MCAAAADLPLQDLKSGSHVRTSHLAVSRSRVRIKGSHARHMQNMGRGRIFARNGIYIQEQGFGQGLEWNVKALANQHRSEKIEVGLGWGEAENIHCMALAKKKRNTSWCGIELDVGWGVNSQWHSQASTGPRIWGGWGVGSTEMLKVHWFSPTTSENIGVEWGWRWWGGTVALTAKTLRKSCSLLVSSAIGPAKSKSSFFEMAWDFITSWHGSRK